ncbi:MAG: PLP-dependent aminotransferase family protein [Rhodospirillaceae bacterium]|nr:MAG: PLP-dependent aminotransferase family protein [Rhodospirillaceae bacterium]
MPRRAGIGSLLMPHLDPALPEPLFRQLYSELRQAILGGRLTPGARMPASRAFADELSVSRNTVLGAYEQLLSEGYLEMRPGSGTYVAADLPDLLPERGKKPSAKEKAQQGPLADLARRAGTLVDPEANSRQSRDGIPGSVWTPCFIPGLPDCSDFPFAAWSRLLAKTWRDPGRALVMGGDPGGYLPLREAVADYLRQVRGVDCAAEDVLIVSGIRQAVDLTCRLLIDPGDPVWVERPGFPGLRAAIAAQGAQLVHVPVDGEGLDVADGLRQAAKARLACVAPSHQYPLGVVMSLQRRLALLAWAREANAWILEDDYDSEYRYTGRPLAALRSLDEDGRVIYMGSLSKLLFPSLRLGYLVTPPRLTAAFRHARSVIDDQPSMSSQPALAALFQSGLLAAHVRRMRKRYARRQQLLLQAAAKHLDGQIELRPDEAGLHLVGQLVGRAAQRFDDETASHHLRQAGLVVPPLSRYDVGPQLRRGLMFGYAAIPDMRIEPAIALAAKILKQ